MGKLNDTKLRNLKPDPPRIRMIGDGNRLYVAVYPTGTKTFMLRSSTRTKKGFATIGTYPDMTLKEARHIASGDNKSTGVLFNKSTVADLAKEFYDSQIAPRYRRPKQIERYLERDLETIATRKVVDISRSDLSALLRQKTRDGPVAANRLLAIIRRMFRFAVKSGVIENDPSALLDRSIAGGKEKARDRTLSDVEIQKLWAATENGAGTPWGPKFQHGPLLRFLLITGQRIAETQAAAWDDIDEKARIWKIPEENTKSQRAHWVGLPDLALELLKSLPRDTDRVFRKHTKTNNPETAVQSWLKRWCEREEITPAFTPHDLRRTVATRMNELGIAPHIVERIMNHALQGTMAVYNRAEYSKERQEAQQLWAKSLSSLVQSAPTTPKKKSRQKLKP